MVSKEREAGVDDVGIGMRLGEHDRAFDHGQELLSQFFGWKRYTGTVASITNQVCDV